MRQENSVRNCDSSPMNNRRLFSLTSTVYGKGFLPHEFVESVAVMKTFGFPVVNIVYVFGLYEFPVV